MKLRAQACCILGKYLYQYGGLNERGEISNVIIRINLCQNKGSLFKWKKVSCSFTDTSIKLIPERAYVKMCSIYYEHKFQTKEDPRDFKFEDLS